MEFSLDDNIYYLEKIKSKKDGKDIFTDDEGGASIKHRTLSIEDYQKVFKFIGKTTSESDEDQKGLAMLADESFTKISKELIEKYCFDLKGIILSENSQKRDATIQDLSIYGIFSNYLMGILMDLVSSSEVSAKEELEVKK